MSKVSYAPWSARAFRPFERGGVSGGGRAIQEPAAAVEGGSGLLGAPTTEELGC